MVGYGIKEEGITMTDSLVCSWLRENSSLRLHLEGEGPNHVEQHIWRAAVASSCVVGK